MKRLTFLFFVTLVMQYPPHGANSASTGPSTPNAEHALQDWLDACRAVSAVRCEVQIYSYDLTWRTFSRSKGQFGYRSPTQAYWMVEPDAVQSAREKTINGEPYRKTLQSKKQWWWIRDRLVIVDDDARTFAEFPLVSSDKRSPLFGVWDVEVMFPFRPGLPRIETLNRFTYEIVAENATEVRLHAIPKPSTANRKVFESCDLILKKDPWRLYAVRYSHPGGDAVTVHVFGNVESDPAPWTDPDLGEYKRAN